MICITKSHELNIYMYLFLVPDGGGRDGYLEDIILEI